MAKRVPAALLVAGVALSLVVGIFGGLLRAGVAPEAIANAAWSGHAALSHAALMIGGFLGTVIGIERAVAMRHWLAWSAPAFSAAAGVLLVMGESAAAGVLLLLAATAFIAVNGVLWRRQPAPHTALLLAAAGAWWVGNAIAVTSPAAGAVIEWWFAFVIMTITAERLELARLMRRKRGAQLLLYTTLGALGAGAALSSLSPEWGGALYGIALVVLSVWLFTNDVARRTITAAGLARYMAVCLLCGYAWLAIGGLAWTATALGAPLRDAALHSIGLGLVLSMIMGHAPVILPAVAGVKLLFGPAFYLPLALLHGSLLVRVFGAPLSAPLRGLGALWNVAAIGAFAATLAAAALAWRRHHAAAQTRPRRA
jgi:hypothetical protein